MKYGDRVIIAKTEYVFLGKKWVLAFNSKIHYTQSKLLEKERYDTPDGRYAQGAKFIQPKWEVFYNWYLKIQPEPFYVFASPDEKYAEHPNYNPRIRKSVYAWKSVKIKNLLSNDPNFKPYTGRIGCSTFLDDYRGFSLMFDTKEEMMAFDSFTYLSKLPASQIAQSHYGDSDLISKEDNQ